MYLFDFNLIKNECLDILNVPWGVRQNTFSIRIVINTVRGRVLLSIALKGCFDKGDNVSSINEHLDCV